MSELPLLPPLELIQVSTGNSFFAEAEMESFLSLWGGYLHHCVTLYHKTNMDVLLW